jgi:hypothetical protein
MQCELGQGRGVKSTRVCPRRERGSRDLVRSGLNKSLYSFPLRGGMRWAFLRRIHSNRLKNRTMLLPRAERPEQLKDFFTLAPKHVVHIDRARIGVFAEQKVD